MITKPIRFQFRWGYALLLGLLAGGLGWFIFQNFQPKPTYQTIVFQTKTGWGYEIRQNSKPVIYQPIIPGLGGNRPFATQQQAHAVGDAVTEKMRQGQFPPEITRQELAKLGVY
jgi:Domain of unknown function (DUF4907)